MLLWSYQGQISRLLWYSPIKAFLFDFLVDSWRVSFNVPTKCCNWYKSSSSVYDQLDQTMGYITCTLHRRENWTLFKYLVFLASWKVLKHFSDLNVVKNLGQYLITHLKIISSFNCFIHYILLTVLFIDFYFQMSFEKFCHFIILEDSFI